MPSVSGGGGNTTAQVVASGKVLPVADAAGVTVDTTTYNDPLEPGSKLTTLIFPAEAGTQGALAIANAGDAFPRWYMAADATAGIAFGDGSWDAGTNGPNLYVNSAVQMGLTARLIIYAAAQANEAAQLGQVSPFGTITAGALPTVQLVSTVGARILTTQDAETITPVTFNSGAANTATCLIALSPDNVTYSALGTETEPIGVALAGTVHLVKVRVPAGWYIKLTATNATLGLTTYY